MPRLYNRAVKNGDKASARELKQYVIKYRTDFGSVSIPKPFSFITKLDVEHQSLSFSDNT